MVNNKIGEESIGRTRKKNIRKLNGKQKYVLERSK